MTASERRNAILEILCMRRVEKINNLAFQFGVTEKTIRRDILTLSLEYPIYTAQGNGGGIYVDKNIRVGRSEKMTKKAETDYTIKVNGMPNYANIPKAVLEPIAKKFLENILKEQQKKET